MLAVMGGLFYTMPKEKATSTDGQIEVPLNEFIPDPNDSNERVMYTREKKVRFCKKGKHNLNPKTYECESCPFVFVGFRANMHIYKDGGVFERKPRHALGRRLA